MPKHGQRYCAERLCISSAPPTYEGNGEGGIRTLGTLLGYGALAKRCFRPLSHLTNKLAEYGEEIPIANLDILGRASAVGKADSFPSEASSFAYSPEKSLIAVANHRLPNEIVRDDQRRGGTTEDS